MENVVKLSKTDRAKFIYLLKILKNQGDEEYDYDNMIKALQYGYEYHYSDVFDCLFDEELSADGCREVLDILEMYRGIIYSYINLKREGIQLSLTEDDIRFPGFDGNNEGKQMFYTEYFIKDLGRYNEIEQLSHGYYNSHWPELPKYRAMLLKWEEYKVLPNRYMMNEQQIRDLLECY
jgi:uncharacterized protein YfbU (UPF0304 family)